jgi:hypothetical protein
LTPQKFMGMARWRQPPEEALEPVAEMPANTALSPRSLAINPERAQQARR